MQHTSLFTVMRVELCRNQLSICYKRLRRHSARRSHLFQLALWGLFSSQHNAGYNSPEVFLILIAVRASPSPTLNHGWAASSKKSPLSLPGDGTLGLDGITAHRVQQGSQTMALDLFLEEVPLGIVSILSRKPAAPKSPT